MSNNITNHELALTFRRVFPEYAAKMDAAKTEEEKYKAYEEILGMARAKYQNVMKQTLGDDAPNGYAPIALKPEQVQSLISASGDQIKVRMDTLMQSIELLQNYENDEEMMGVQMSLAGMAAITVSAIPVVAAKLLEGIVEITAIIEGIAAASPAAIIAAVGIIVILIVIPIIYFITKPAMGCILLINELEEDLEYTDSSFTHGKLTGYTETIPKCIIVPQSDGSPAHVYAASGFYTGSKIDYALIGVQAGFTLAGKSSGKTFSFGFDCPLSSMYVDNNCYCSVGGSAEDAAQKTDDNNKQEWKDEKDGYGIEIKCNSPSGSVAYYIARIYKK